MPLVLGASFFEGIAVNDVCILSMIYYIHFWLLRTINLSAYLNKLKLYFKHNHTQELEIFAVTSSNVSMPYIPMTKMRNTIINIYFN